MPRDSDIILFTTDRHAHGNVSVRASWKTRSYPHPRGQSSNRTSTRPGNVKPSPSLANAEYRTAGISTMRAGLAGRDLARLTNKAAYQGCLREYLNLAARQAPEGVLGSMS